MGNDLAGGKVYPAPEVVEVPITVGDPNILELEHPDLFRVSVLTRAQSRNLTREVELSDSMFDVALTEGRLPPLVTLGSVSTKSLKN